MATTNTVPVTYGASVDQPFRPIGVRDQYDELYRPNNKRLTDEEIRNLINTPPETKKDERLDEYNELANVPKTRVYQLTVIEILQNMSKTIRNIIDELVNGEKPVRQIFTEEDRLIYLGIVIFSVTLIIILIRSV